MGRDFFKGALEKLGAPGIAGRVLLLILVLSLFLNLWNNHFPPGYHSDEVGKVMFVQGEKMWNFCHPILMVYVVKAAKAVFGLDEAWSIFLAGRTMSAVFGMLIVFLSYLIARDALGRKYALFTSLAVAISPIMVVHAHYFKEDMIGTFFMLLCLLLFLRFIRSPSFRSACLLGVSTGLACSSQYKAMLLFVLYLVSPLIVPSAIRGAKAYYKKILLVVGVALVVFGAVNWSLFTSLDYFKAGVSFEASHVLAGHDVKIWAPEFFFTFHLLRSIVPGITPLLALLACGYILIAFFRWKDVPWQERVLISYVFLFYFASEAIPLKPFPDFMRYMIPIVPVLLYFVCALFKKLETGRFRLRASLVAGLLVLALLPVLRETILLDHYLVRDTRAELVSWLIGKNDRFLSDEYTTDNLWREDLPVIRRAEVITDEYIERARREGGTYALASSFSYERYLLGGMLSGQHPRVYGFYKNYTDLFKKPYIEIKPAFKSFAFSNPTIRIIEL